MMSAMCIVIATLVWDSFRENIEVVEGVVGGTFSSAVKVGSIIRVDGAASGAIRQQVI
jgi:membrane protein involved in colicin uptake